MTDDNIIWWSLLMIFMITLILIITMIVDWLVIIWRWTWVVIMIMPIDSRFSLLIDYDEKHDWWFSDDNWSWLMNDDKGHRWWFIVIDNEVMDDKWLTDLLIDDKIMIMITKSVIIPAVSGLYRPTGLLFSCENHHGISKNGYVSQWNECGARDLIQIFMWHLFIFTHRVL